MAVRVPNTNAYSLVHVRDAVKDHASSVQDNLDSCFDYAISSYFDAIYNHVSYAPENSLKRFRNYGPGGGEDPWLPEGFSPNGDGINDTLRPVDLDDYTDNEVRIFNVCGNLIYKTTNYHQSSNWWDGKMKEASRWGSGNCSSIYYTQGTDVPVGNYIWFLYINGSQYSNGTVMLAR